MHAGLHGSPEQEMKAEAGYSSAWKDASPRSASVRYETDGKSQGL